MKNQIQALAEQSNYITLEEYANSHSISLEMLLKDIVSGKYETAVCYIDSDETCKTVAIKKKPIGFASQFENYVTAKKYSRIHKITYAGLLRGLKRGYYKTAFQEEDNKWYLDKDDDGWKSPLSQGYVSAKEFSEMNSINYGTLLSELQNGYYKTAFQDQGRHWFLKPTDQKDKTPKPDPELDGYISMKEYAELNKVNYQVLSEDVRNGVYDSVIIRKQGRFIYFPKNTPCKSNSIVLETVGYLTIKEYAEKNDLDSKKLKQDVIAGKYHTAKKVGNVWYIRNYERPKTYDIPKNYILLSDYAENHNIDYKYIHKDVKEGKYLNAQKFGRNWYIDRYETCVTETPIVESTVLPSNYISVKEYASLVGFSYMKVKRDVEEGLYSTAVKNKSRWYIDKNEPCKSFDRRKNTNANVILLREYARLHNVSYPRIQRDVKAGVYKTVQHINGKWYIDGDEEFKSFDKRKLGSELITVKQYSENHSLPYQKVLNDIKNGIYTSAIQRNKRWYIDRKETVKTTVRKYHKKPKE